MGNIAALAYLAVVPILMAAGIKKAISDLSAGKKGNAAQPAVANEERRLNASSNTFRPANVDDNVIDVEPQNRSGDTVYAAKGYNGLVRVGNSSERHTAGWKPWVFGGLIGSVVGVLIGAALMRALAVAAIAQLLAK